MTDRDQRRRLNLSAAAASIAVATALVLMKLWAQIETGSLTVAASLADSALDLVISVANAGALVYAARPADADHRFGHDAAEDIAALGQSLLVGVSAGAIFVGAVWRLFEPRPLEAEAAGLGVMAASILLTWALVWWQARVARRTGSKVVAADRAHYLGDLLPNLAAVTALGASAAFGFGWLDPWLALLAALWLGRVAFGVGAEALDGLMDREAPAEIRAAIVEMAEQARADGVVGFHDLKTRKSGAKLFVQIHVEIDGDAPLRDAHEIGEKLRRRILALSPDVEVLIHKDPV